MLLNKRIELYCPQYLSVAADHSIFLYKYAVTYQISILYVKVI